MPFDKQVSAKSYLIEVAKGNIPGASIINVSGRNAALGTDIEDIWGGGLLSTLDYDAQTVNFTAGLVLTGATSGATAVIVIDDDFGSTGTLTIRKIEGVFQNDEIITDSGSGSAASDGIISSLGLKIDAVSGEQWEVICESSDDDATGTGARSIVVLYIDANFNEQVEVKPLSGHTSSLFAATDALCPRIVAVITYGSATNPITGKSNTGAIVIRETTTKQIRAVVAFNDSNPGSEFGLNIAQDSHLIIPAGKVGFITNVFTNVSKDHEADTLIMVSDQNNEGYISGGEISVYQNSTSSNTSLSPQPIFEKTKIKFISSSNNDAVDVNISYGVLLEDSSDVAVSAAIQAP